jgi:AcrR family transcriptional regulator
MIGRQGAMTTQRTKVLRARRREMTSDERHQQIVDASARLFQISGYEAVTMQDIADKIGIAKPTLYHYFRSKDEILLAIHEDFIEILLERLAERVEDTHGPEQIIEGVMHDVLSLMDTHLGHVRVFFEHHRELPEESRSEMRRRRDEYELAVEEQFRLAMDAGTMRVASPRLATLAVFGMCNWAYQWYRSGGALSSDDIASNFWDFLYNGLKS